ncbi:MAG: PIN domain-containing protein [Thiobacillaceae bacterium]|jgi:predicted nucleic acid-binding protein|nr:PIN domain-containing protein [Thiobacillaceae bacterium]
MPDRRFIDTNVLLYLYSEDEPDKKSAAEAVVRDGGRAWISTQVLSEVANVLRRKFGLEYQDIAAVVEEVRGACDIHVVSADTVALALKLGERYRHSYYDSLILAAALECGCDTLASEDMQDGLVVESRLTIRNPFA